mgnify:FL=1
MVIVMPNGLLLCWGPFRGGANDQGCANTIGLVGLLEQYAQFEDVSFSVLADGGYRSEQQVIIPYPGPNLTEMQQVTIKMLFEENLKHQCSKCKNKFCQT